MDKATSNRPLGDTSDKTHDIKPPDEPFNKLLDESQCIRSPSDNPPSKKLKLDDNFSSEEPDEDQPNKDPDDKPPSKKT